MIQLVQCVQRLVVTLADKYYESTSFGFTEIDIKDGFWRPVVSDTDSCNFCYALPQFKKVENIEDIKVVVKNCLNIGWCELIPLFFAVSETARDFIDTLLHEVNLTEHPFEEHMTADQTENPRHRLTAAVIYTNLVEVFVYYFIAATNNLYLSHLTHFSREMLHGVNSIFHPPNFTKHQDQDPISQKKTSQGE